MLASIARYVMLYGGSRSGKTFILVYAVIARALKAPHSRHAIFRHRFNHVKTSIIYDTLPKVMQLAFPKVSYEINKTDWFIEFPNGSQIWFGGLDAKDRSDKVLGHEYATIYFNECSELDFESVETGLSRLAQNVEGLDLKAYFDCNPPSIKHWSYKMFVQKINPEDLTPYFQPELYAYLQMNPTHNRENLKEGYIEQILGSMSARKRKRFLQGEFLEDNEGALWTSTTLEKYRISFKKFMEEVEQEYAATGVDPAVTNKASSDDTGIVTCIRGRNGHYYCIADSSLKSTPLGWAHAANNDYEEFQCDKIIGEVNNGGDLVEQNMRLVNPDINFKQVRASKGKAIRAEPVAALAEQGRFHIVGELPDLESEMTGWVPDSGDPSPNRIDALVWAMYGIMKGRSTSPRVRILGELVND